MTSSFMHRIALAAVLAMAMHESPAAEPAAIQQLRVYRLHAGNEAAFHERFRDHAMRIMARHGFRILATWDSRAEDGRDFVYLLEWPDEATMRACWDAFLADPEWKAIKRETAARHGTFVDGIEERTLVPTPYSPARKGSD